MRKTNRSGLYVILDRQWLKTKNIKEVASQVIDGGADIIQLRDKVSRDNDTLCVASKLARITKRRRTKFVVNDSLHIALISKADGLHLGQSDLPVSFARLVLGKNKILGVSAETTRDALLAQENGADYVAVGAVFPTASKDDAKIVGLNLLRDVKRRLRVPVVAIGGINMRNAKDVINSNADMVAVASAVLKQKNIKEATRKIKEICQRS